MPADKFHISLPPEITAEIAARADKAAGERSGRIAQDLARYYEALARARKGMCDKFSKDELSAILDVCNGAAYEAHSIPWLYAGMEDALAGGVADKWGIDGAALVANLRALSYIESAALVDAAERAWRAVGNNGALNPAEMLA
jgi:hypothetical protein